MGHEFVEMKNTGAAIEHYRSVFEINEEPCKSFKKVADASYTVQLY